MMINSHGWTVDINDDGRYKITDPKGQVCLSEYVRIINAEEFVIGHAVYRDLPVKTDSLRYLPATFVGDLNALEKKHRNDADNTIIVPRLATTTKSTGDKYLHEE